ncbi:type II toxin-antitoxin system RelE/ParE family toxin [Sphingorhabdus sp. SMR4y]|uniref:type II toxin-antitoxin system RelE/ParE family toxin n=1 Tax=Sphingorhabdus sp. SMR4y TaxID=2584094 RepID=UPI000B5C354D|nr:type II toxin-antitoxin system RelE/ParE family toxin [Sphingorhabdus sp. SMR4y]ASK87948.1 ParE toxin of type II toxin-antitoxin system, parDE [Sphingorhabdus sp. SMR4y]
MIEFSSGAVRDLNDIFDWIAQDSPAVALRILGRLRQNIEILADFPQLGKVGRIENTYELSVTGLPYIVVYRLGVGGKSDNILIDAILHTSRNYPSVN